MTKRHRRIANMVFGLVLLPFTAIAGAQPPAEVAQQCAPDPAKVPPELTGWHSRAALVAAKDPVGLQAAAIQPGVPVQLQLSPLAVVRYSAPPEKAGEEGSHGGLVSLSVEKPGTYRVALGGPVWIDMLEGGKSVASTGHGHGPDCSGVRKMVDFPLMPGAHVLQLTGSAAETVALMVVRMP